MDQLSGDKAGTMPARFKLKLIRPIRHSDASSRDAALRSILSKSGAAQAAVFSASSSL
jgi:hypothetical protein